MEDLQAYVYEHIPIVRKNNFKIVEFGERIEVSGNFKEHINHRNSVFGGSLSNALIISAWAYARKIIHGFDCANTIIVIQTQEVKFILPVTKKFTSVNKEVSNQIKDKALAMLNKFGKTRLEIESYITHEEENDILASFKGQFAIIKKSSADI